MKLNGTSPPFGGGQAKRGSFPAGSGGFGEGDEAAVHTAVQALDRRERGAVRGAGRDRKAAQARRAVQFASVGVAEGGAGGVAAGVGEEARPEAVGREA